MLSPNLPCAACPGEAVVVQKWSPVLPTVSGVVWVWVVHVWLARPRESYHDGHSASVVGGGGADVRSGVLHEG